MSLKIRNVANDASVTLIDGGGVGSPSIDIDVRNLFQNVQTAGGTMTGALEVPAGATGIEVPQVQEVEALIANAVAAAIANAPTIESGATWIKFPDGTLIKYGEVNLGSQVMDQVWGSVTHSTEVSYGSFDSTVPFIAVPSVTITVMEGYAWITPEVGPTATTLGSGYMTTPETLTMDVVLAYHAIGRWK